MKISGNVNYCPAGIPCLPPGIDVECAADVTTANIHQVPVKVKAVGTRDDSKLTVLITAKAEGRPDTTFTTNYDEKSIDETELIDLRFYQGLQVSLTVAVTDRKCNETSFYSCVIDVAALSVCLPIECSSGKAFDQSIIALPNAPAVGVSVEVISDDSGEVLAEWSVVGDFNPNEPYEIRASEINDLAPAGCWVTVRTAFWGDCPADEVAAGELCDVNMIFGDKFFEDAHRWDWDDVKPLWHGGRRVPHWIIAADNTNYVNSFGFYSDSDDGKELRPVDVRALDITTVDSLDSDSLTELFVEWSGDFTDALSAEFGGEWSVTGDWDLIVADGRDFLALTQMTINGRNSTCCPDGWYAYHDGWHSGHNENIEGGLAGKCPQCFFRPIIDGEVYTDLEHGTERAYKDAGYGELVVVPSEDQRQIGTWCETQHQIPGVKENCPPSRMRFPNCEVVTLEEPLGDIPAGTTVLLASAFATTQGWAGRLHEWNCQLFDNDSGGLISDEPDYFDQYERQYFAGNWGDFATIAFVLGTQHFGRTLRLDCCADPFPFLEQVCDPACFTCRTAIADPSKGEVPVPDTSIALVADDYNPATHVATVHVTSFQQAGYQITGTWISIKDAEGVELEYVPISGGAVENAPVTLSLGKFCDQEVEICLIAKNECGLTSQQSLFVDVVGAQSYELFSLDLDETTNEKTIALELPMGNWQANDLGSVEFFASESPYYTTNGTTAFDVNVIGNTAYFTFADPAVDAWELVMRPIDVNGVPGCKYTASFICTDRANCEYFEHPDGWRAPTAQTTISGDQFLSEAGNLNISTSDAGVGLRVEAIDENGALHSHDALLPQFDGSNLVDIQIAVVDALAACLGGTWNVTANQSQAGNIDSFEIVSIAASATWNRMMFYSGPSTILGVVNSNSDLMFDIRACCDPNVNFDCEIIRSTGGLSASYCFTSQICGNEAVTYAGTISYGGASTPFSILAVNDASAGVAKAVIESEVPAGITEAVISITPTSGGTAGETQTFTCPIVCASDEQVQVNFICTEPNSLEQVSATPAVLQVHVPTGATVQQLSVKMKQERPDGTTEIVPVAWSDVNPVEGVWVGQDADDWRNGLATIDYIFPVDLEFIEKGDFEICLQWLSSCAAVQADPFLVERSIVCTRHWWFPDCERFEKADTLQPITVAIDYDASEWTSQIDLDSFSTLMFIVLSTLDECFPNLSFTAGPGSAGQGADIAIKYGSTTQFGYEFTALNEFTVDNTLIADPLDFFGATSNLIMQGMVAALIKEIVGGADAIDASDYLGIVNLDEMQKRYGCKLAPTTDPEWPTPVPPAVDCAKDYCLRVKSSGLFSWQMPISFPSNVTDAVFDGTWTGLQTYDATVGIETQAVCTSDEITIQVVSTLSGGGNTYECHATYSSNGTTTTATEASYFVGSTEVTLTQLPADAQEFFGSLETSITQETCVADNQLGPCTDDFCLEISFGAFGPFNSNGSYTNPHYVPVSTSTDFGDGELTISQGIDSNDTAITGVIRLVKFDDGKYTRCDDDTFCVLVESELVYEEGTRVRCEVCFDVVSGTSSTGECKYYQSQPDGSWLEVTLPNAELQQILDTEFAELTFSLSKGACGIYTGGNLRITELPLNQITI